MDLSEIILQGYLLQRKGCDWVLGFLLQGGFNKWGAEKGAQISIFVVFSQ